MPPHDVGSIEVICGPMFSGKTEELIRRLRRAQLARQGVQVFKPAVDDRYDLEDIVSHDAQRLRAEPIRVASELLERVLPDTRVVGVDETQFFDATIVAVVNRLADSGVRVIVAGLDADYRSVPFEPMPQLIASAEYVTKLSAICVSCGAPANRSQRIAGGTSRVEVGAAHQYEARCRRCFTPFEGGVDR